MPSQKLFLQRRTTCMILSEPVLLAMVSQTPSINDSLPLPFSAWHDIFNHEFPGTETKGERQAVFRNGRFSILASFSCFVKKEGVP